MPEPDGFHDPFGRLTQVAAPVISRVRGELAQAARGADKARLEAVELVDWFTIEFGVVRDGEGVHASRARLTSSIAELERALRVSEVEQRPFELGEACVSGFATDPRQPRYFVMQNLEVLVREMRVAC